MMSGIMRQKDWWTGNNSPEKYRKSIVGLAFYLIVMLIISMVLYPSSFSFVKIAVSPLGYVKTNPIGSFFFNIGLLITGLMLIPHTFFLIRQIVMLLNEKPWHLLQIFMFYSGAFLLLLSGPGMAMVGLTPEDLCPNAHLMAAIFAFGGLFFGAFFLLWSIYSALRGERKRGGVDRSLRFFVLLYAQLIAVAIINLWIAIIPAMMGKLTGSFTGMPAYWPITEWTLFASNFLWYIGIIAIFTTLKKG
jgi:hypothetical protein